MGSSQRGASPCNPTPGLRSSRRATGLLGVVARDLAVAKATAAGGTVPCSAWAATTREAVEKGGRHFFRDPHAAALSRPSGTGPQASRGSGPLRAGRAVPPARGSISTRRPPSGVQAGQPWKVPISPRLLARTATGAEAAKPASPGFRSRPWISIPSRARPGSPVAASSHRSLLPCPALPGPPRPRGTASFSKYGRARPPHQDAPGVGCWATGAVEAACGGGRRAQPVPTAARSAGTPDPASGKRPRPARLRQRRPVGR